MASKASYSNPYLLVITSFFFFLSVLILPSLSSSSESSINTNYIISICESTPYPSRCIETSEQVSLGLIPKINTNPTITLDPVVLALAQQTLQHALTVATNLNPTINTLESSGIVETQKGTILDCKELHYITLDHLQTCINLFSSQTFLTKVVRIYLSAALTNKQTCLEGLQTSSGAFKPVLEASLDSFYQLVSNALSIITKGSASKVSTINRRRLMGFDAGRGRGGFPSWLSRKDRRLLQSSGTEGSDSNTLLTVAQDGSGNFTRISDAILAVPKNSTTRVVVYVKEGVYEEYIQIPKNKRYVALIGDGEWRTIITGNHSVGDNWTTYRSATVGVAGIGFLARDLTIRNTAGAVKHQAVALRLNADLSAVYRCTVEGFQDTLYTHSLRQFYRESVISGTVDFIFGNAAVVFQACQIVSRRPMDGQFNAVTAQGRTDPNENTGISIDNCTILPDTELADSNGTFKSYLGRPWKNYSRTAIMTSYVGEHIDPSGWTPWDGNFALETLYYGEYANYGPGSSTDKRVKWTGYTIMTYDDATNFTVPNFILGDQWLDSQAVPYDTGV